MSDLQIFLWAMLHHPSFPQCRIRLPFWMQLRREYGHDNYRIYALRAGVRPLSVYLAWEVKEGFYRAYNLKDPFDDISF